MAATEGPTVISFTYMVGALTFFTLLLLFKI